MNWGVGVGTGGGEQVVVSWTVRILPLALRVQRWRSEQPSQWLPNRAWRERALIVTVIPFGQVAVISAKIDTVVIEDEPVGDGRCGAGIRIDRRWWPLLARWWRNSPEPYAESASTSTGAVSPASSRAAAWASPTLPAVNSHAVIRPAVGFDTRWALKPVAVIVVRLGTWRRTQGRGPTPSARTRHRRDPPRIVIVAGFDVWPGDQRQQPDCLDLHDVELDAVEHGKDRAGVGNRAR